MNSMNTQYLNFGDFLQRKRTEKKITIRKMAEMLGITAPYLNDIEKDRRNPPEMEKLELISQILMLSDEDKTTMFDLAGKKRNSVAPDLPDYLFERRNLLTGSDFGDTQKHGTVKRTQVSNMEIWCECFGKERTNIRRTDSNELTAILARLGWKRLDSKVRIPLYGPQYVFVPKECS